MTSNISIYDKAIASLDDPVLTQIYKESKIDFCNKMHTFLNRAIPLFNTPYSEAAKLSSSLVNPREQQVVATGDGVNSKFYLDDALLGECVITEAKVNNVAVKGVFNEEDKSFIFENPPTEGSSIIFRQYDVGYFNKDLDQTEETILALLLVSCWAEKEENFLLDIRRLLMTSDFKLHDSSSTLRSKVNWHYTMYEKAQKLMNNYSLNLMKRRVL